jgi:hypothetical protein
VAEAFERYEEFLSENIGYLESLQTLGNRLSPEEISDLEQSRMERAAVTRRSYLFTYSDLNRAEMHARNGGLRISDGAENEELHQIGNFPRGAYGTSIPPWSRGVNRGAMRLNFFNYEFSMPGFLRGVAKKNVPIPKWVKGAAKIGWLDQWLFDREPLSMDHFVAVPQTFDWVPGGYLNQISTRRRFGDFFTHFSLREDSRPGAAILGDQGDSLIRQRIVVTGPSHIAEGGVAAGRGRASSLHETPRVRTDLLEFHVKFDGRRATIERTLYQPKRLPRAEPFGLDGEAERLEEGAAINLVRGALV